MQEDKVKKSYKTYTEVEKKHNLLQSNQKVVAEVKKNDKEKIIISANRYNGTKYVDVRVWYKDDNSGEYRPSKKGLAINLKILPEITEKMIEAGKVSI
jgi:hypothetical protein